MKSVIRILAALAAVLAVGSAGAARAGAPQPDQRQGDFAHVCQGGPNKEQACTVATQDADCPRSALRRADVEPAIKGTLTVIAHDSVTDWLNGGAANRALTVMLEVKGPDGSKQILAATYQDLATPTDPPTAPATWCRSNGRSRAEDDLRRADGLLFVQPESTLSQQLQTLFNSTGTPVIVARDDGEGAVRRSHRRRPGHGAALQGEDPIPRRRV